MMSPPGLSLLCSGSAGSQCFNLPYHDSLFPPPSIQTSFSTFMGTPRPLLFDVPHTHPRSSCSRNLEAQRTICSVRRSKSPDDQCPKHCEVLARCTCRLVVEQSGIRVIWRRTQEESSVARVTGETNCVVFALSDPTRWEPICAYQHKASSFSATPRDSYHPFRILQIVYIQTIFPRYTSRPSDSHVRS